MITYSKRPTHLKARFKFAFLIAVPILVSYTLCARPLTKFIFIWSISQWLPNSTNKGWNGHYWERMHQILIKQLKIEQEHKYHGRNSRRTNEKNSEKEIQTVDVQTHRNNLLSYLEQNYGRDWRQRPVLFKQLWSKDDLRQNSDGTLRRLSLEQLLKEDLKVPYFSDARVKTLSPDHYGPLRDIVRNITMGKPHKIGSQLILERYPGLIQEVAPLNIVTELFGNYFTPDHIKGSGLWNLFPATTTVPIFIAGHGIGTGDGDRKGPSSSSHIDVTMRSTPKQNQPFTALHCEPIGNIAVQLSGRKKWTLVQPQYSFQLKPGLAPDGRAFFASSANKSDCAGVPTYDAITSAGDAMWVPTWTWHRVDYIESSEISIGGSLFHFRSLDFFQNNPLFAALVMPAILKELFGLSTQ